GIERQHQHARRAYALTAGRASRGGASLDPLGGARYPCPAPMLGLVTETDPSWVEAAQRDLGGLLSDHAHCELKAAVSALSIVCRFGATAPVLVAPLAALAQEETAHFRAVHARLVERTEPRSLPEQDAYVNALWNSTKPDRDRVPMLLDRLLVNALIEARSCERFKLLSERLEDAGLRTFYRELME